jgi:hypothetical protein
MSRRQKIIDVFMCKLQKLAKASGGENYIETMWGRGYRLRAPHDKTLTTASGDAGSRLIPGSIQTGQPVNAIQALLVQFEAV